jgi:hypothetical protein
MQAQQILQPLQNGTLRIAKLFLKENPDILQKYVDTGTAVLSLAKIPLNVFMKHLLEVQGIDPNTVPGEKARKALQDALDNTIETHHAKDYDADYEFAPFYQKFQELRKKMNITKEKFKAMTDLSNLPVGPGRYPTSDEEQEFFQRCHELNRVAPKKELPLDTKEGRQARREKVLREMAAQLKEEGKTTAREVIATIDPIVDLRKAVEAIEKAVGLTEPKKGIKTSKKKANKKPTRIVKVSTRTLSGRTEMHERLVKKMIANGLCKDSPEAMATQMQEMAKWDDKAFEAMERVVGKYVTTKNTDNKFRGNFRRVFTPVTKAD